MNTPTGWNMNQLTPQASAEQVSEGTSVLSLLDASPSLRKFATIVAGVIATSGSLPQETQGQEKPQPAAVAPLLQDEPESVSPVKPAILSAEYQNGYAEGFVAGKISVLVESLKKDITAIDKTITAKGTVEEKDTWKTVQNDILERLTILDKNLTPGAKQFNAQSALKEITADIRLVTTYGLLARRLEGVDQKGAPSGNALDSTVRLEHGDIISLDIYNKLLKPFVDQIQRTVPEGSMPQDDDKTLEGLRLPRPLPGPSEQQLQGFRSLRDSLRQGLRNDVQKIKEQRARDAEKRDTGTKSDPDN